jgi:hypothetical protein
MTCLVAACDAGEKPPSPTKPAPKIEVVRPDLSEPLMYLPADSDFVIKLDVAALRRAKLWQLYGNDIGKLLLPGLSGCTYDAASEMSLVTIGVPLATEAGVLVVRGIDRDKTLQCLHASTAATFDGDFVTLTHKTRDVRTLTFADAHTMVVQFTKLATKQTLTQVLQSRAPLAQDQAFVAAFKTVTERLPPGAVMMVSRPGSTELAAKWTQIGAHLEQLSATMRVSDRLDLRLQMQVATPDEATQFSTMLQSQLKSIKQMLDRGEVTAQGKLVTFDLGMTETQVASIAGIFRGMQAPD